MDGMSTHRIRLGPPWDAAADGTHSRRFGRPRSLGPGERVWLVCHLPPDAAVTVNGHAVPASADVTDLLGPRNEVTVRLPPGGERGEVALEIRSEA
jgi:hypothetical protein